MFIIPPLYMYYLWGHYTTHRKYHFRLLSTPPLGGAAKVFVWVRHLIVVPPMGVLAKPACCTHSGEKREFGWPKPPLWLESKHP